VIVRQCFPVWEEYHGALTVRIEKKLKFQLQLLRLLAGGRHDEEWRAGLLCRVGECASASTAF